MKFRITIILLLATVLSVQAQWWGNKRIKGNGDVVVESRTTGEYDRVMSAGSFDIFLVKGTEGKLSIKGEENLMEYIITEVENGKLVIKVERGIHLRPSYGKKIQITVPFEQIEGMALIGAGDVVAKDRIISANFKATVTGSGNMKLLLDSENAKASVTGSGDIHLDGRGEYLRAVISGSGDIHAYNFKAEELQATISGSGDIEAFASKSLKARISGSGDIDVKGKPKKEDSKVSGSGEITTY
ncbi:MAG: DUF2807 domain-containing protein [Flavobacteriaceae bacterium]|nr:DUF2807 domain-containing protein [Flavobacteriaceae bacterium]